MDGTGQKRKEKNESTKNIKHMIRLSLSLYFKDDFGQLGSLCVARVQKFDGLRNKRPFGPVFGEQWVSNSTVQMVEIQRRRQMGVSNHSQCYLPGPYKCFLSLVMQFPPSYQLSLLSF